MWSFRALFCFLVRRSQAKAVQVSWWMLPAERFPYRTTALWKPSETSLIPLWEEVSKLRLNWSRKIWDRTHHRNIKSRQRRKGLQTPFFFWIRRFIPGKGRGVQVKSWLPNKVRKPARFALRWLVHSWKMFEKWQCGIPKQMKVSIFSGSFRLTFRKLSSAISFCRCATCAIPIDSTVADRSATLPVQWRCCTHFQLESVLIAPHIKTCVLQNDRKVTYDSLLQSFECWGQTSAAARPHHFEFLALPSLKKCTTPCYFRESIGLLLQGSFGPLDPKENKSVRKWVLGRVGPASQKNKTESKPLTGQCVVDLETLFEHHLGLLDAGAECPPGTHLL